MTITTIPSSNLDRPRTSVIARRLSVVAGVLWFGVAASTAAWWETPENWQLWYGMYTLLLGSAAAVTAAAAISAASKDSSAGLGAGLTLIAVCTTMVAWALPVWMLSIAVCYGVFAIGAPEHRRGLGLLAVAQLAGLAVLLAGEAVGVGPSDEWGSHPLAGSAAIATTALLTAAALAVLNWGPRQPAPVR